MKILLDEIRHKRKLSIRQLEILTGVKRSNLDNIEKGKRIPRMDTMEQLAKGLRVHITDLFDSEYK